MGTERNNDKLAISMHTEMPDKLSHPEWILQQLTILAEVMQASVTKAMLLASCEELSDVDRETLVLAFRRARRELKFFPKIAELRELAGVGSPEEREDVEAREAYQAVIRSLEREGVDAGIRHLPDRTQYAVRQCGGLWHFNQRLQVRYGDDENPSEMDIRSPIFLQKDFIAAYKAYSIHKAMLSELSQKGLNALPEPVRMFLGKPQPLDTAPQVMESITTPANNAAKASPFRAKSVPQPLSDAQLRDRREMLKQQAAAVIAARTPKAARGEGVMPVD